MDERAARGLALLKPLEPEADQQRLARLQASAPDFAHHVLAFAFRDICARPGLDLRSREIAKIAAPAQLALPIGDALDLRRSRTEILETIMQMAVSAGFPAARNGRAVASEAFAGPGAGAGSAAAPCGGPACLGRAWTAVFRGRPGRRG